MLVTVTEKFIEEVKELKTETMKMMFNAEVLESIDVEGLMFMKRLMSLLDVSMDVMSVQAKAIDGMNEKLDLLLKRKKD